MSKLQWQNGILVCGECWDNPIAWQRPLIIQEVLGDGTEQEGGVHELLKGENQEPEPPQF
jgi:hypothetical protein